MLRTVLLIILTLPFVVKAQDDCINSSSICERCEEFEKINQAINSSLKLTENPKECFDVHEPSKNYINANKQALSRVSLTNGAKFTIFPDQHNIPEPSGAIKKYLKKLKAEGVRVLFMEMLIDDVTYKATEPLPDSRTIKSQLHPEFKGAHFEQLIRAAHKEGLTVEGYFPKNSDETYELIKPWREKRNHINIADQYYTYRILEKAKKYSEDTKFVIQTGLAHTGNFYEQGDPLTNIKLYGELLSQNVKPQDIRLINIRTTSWPELNENINSSEDYFLPLPKGQMPGCGELQPHSLMDAMLFVK